MRHSSCRFAEPGPYQTAAFVTAPALQRTAPQELRAALRPGHGELPVLSRRPEHVSRALVVGVAAGDEEEVGEPVDVFQRRRRDMLAGLVLELHHDPLGPPAYRARQM